MGNIRTYGKNPFRVAVIHGGPGAPGEIAPVARELAEDFGILEPFQGANSIEGQLQELRAVIEEWASQPVTLIGHSWGAWLSFLFAAHYPSLVQKLILVGSGPFEVSYVTEINATRFSRLTEEERRRVEELTVVLQKPGMGEKEQVFAEFGKIYAKTDTYCPGNFGNEIVRYQPEIFQKVMDEAAKLRADGRLLAFGSRIQSPVAAIHGDYDPHPYQGVQDPLSRVLKDFRFNLLNRCGHTPWHERYAKEGFYRILRAELALKDG